MWEEIVKICPDCNKAELRPVRLGNDRDGWEFTGDWECDDCGYIQKFDDHDCHASPEDGCSACDDYREYRDQEIRALNHARH